jgi:hypothetical protein
MDTPSNTNTNVPASYPLDSSNTSISGSGIQSKELDAGQLEKSSLNVKTPDEDYEVPDGGLKAWLAVLGGYVSLSRVVQNLPT